jgi:hypothetical protein
MEPRKTPKQSQKPHLRTNAFLRYTSMCTQMAIIILIGVWGGKKLDEKFPREFPLFTLLCAIASVFIAIYLVIKDLLKK